MKSEISKCDVAFPGTPAVKVSLFSLNFNESEERDDEERAAAASTLLCLGAQLDTPATPLRQRHKEPRGAVGEGWQAVVAPLGCVVTSRCSR